MQYLAADRKSHRPAYHIRRAEHATLDALAADLSTLRGALFGDQIHRPGALPRLEQHVGDLRNQLEALATQIREQRERERLTAARWRWLLLGAASAGALAGGGLWGLIDRLIAFV